MIAFHRLLLNLSRFSSSTNTSEESSHFLLTLSSEDPLFVHFIEVSLIPRRLAYHRCRIASSCALFSLLTFSMIVLDRPYRLGITSVSRSGRSS